MFEFLINELINFIERKNKRILVLIPKPLNIFIDFIEGGVLFLQKNEKKVSQEKKEKIFWLVFL